MHEQIRLLVDHVTQALGFSILSSHSFALRNGLISLDYPVEIVDEVLYEYKVILGESV